MFAEFILIGRKTLVLTYLCTPGGNVLVFESQCLLEHVIVPLFGGKIGFRFGLVHCLLYNFLCL